MRRFHELDSPTPRVGEEHRPTGRAPFWRKAWRGACWRGASPNGGGPRFGGKRGVARAGEEHRPTGAGPVLVDQIPCMTGSEEPRRRSQNLSFNMVEQTFDILAALDYASASRWRGSVFPLLFHSTAMERWHDFALDQAAVAGLACRGERSVAGASARARDSRIQRRPRRLRKGRLNQLPSLDELLLFFPAKHPDGDWSPEDLNHLDVWFEADDGTRLHGWYCPCQRPVRSCSTHTATPAISRTAL